MEWIKSWLIAVTCSALIAALADSLMPQGPVKQVGRMVCGIAMLWSILRPLTALDAGSLWQGLEGLQMQTQAQQMQLEEQNAVMLKSLIERQSGAYILDKAEQLGCTCQVQVECALQDEGVWIPWRVTVRGELTQAQREQLETCIAEELGISVQRQTYTGGEAP